MRKWSFHSLQTTPHCAWADSGVERPQSKTFVPVGAKVSKEFKFRAVSSQLGSGRNNCLAGADILTLDDAVFEKQDWYKTGTHDKKRRSNRIG
ncbi:hypothetical protein ROBYS_25380 [Roseobacter sp. OBYS 0001]|nr:hypothetical protein ROBYS_25380 [Roseobacter sp. OBYS 0001]